MNINASGAVSTLIPDSVAAARGPAVVTPATETGVSKNQDWSGAKEVQTRSTNRAAEAPDALPEARATAQPAETRASRSEPERSELEAEDMAETDGGSSWANEAETRLDIRI